MRASRKLLDTARTHESDRVVAVVQAVVAILTEGRQEEDIMVPPQGGTSDTQIAPVGRWYPHEDRPIVGFQPNIVSYKEGNNVSTRRP